MSYVILGNDSICCFFDNKKTKKILWCQIDFLIICNFFWFNHFLIRCQTIAKKVVGCFLYFQTFSMSTHPVCFLAVDIIRLEPAYLNDLSSHHRWVCLNNKATLLFPVNTNSYTPKQWKLKGNLVEDKTNQLFKLKKVTALCPNVSTTPITAMGFRQCLPLSVVQLKGKHCWKPHCQIGVVDTFGLYLMWNPEICQDAPNRGQNDLVLSASNHG